MAVTTQDALEEAVERLERKIAEYERWFRFLDGQNRVLERERQKLSAVMNHSDVGVILLDARLEADWANEVFSSRFLSGGESRADLTGMPCNQLLCGQDEICGNCPASIPFRTGAVAHHEMDLVVDGRVRHIYASAMPIKSEYGDTEQCLLMLQDVSSLKILQRSEESLKVSETLFRWTFEMAPVGMATAGPDGRFRQVNPALCTALGYTAEELLGMTVLDITHPDDRPASERVYGEVAAGRRRSVMIDKRYLRRDGTTLHAHTEAAWTFDAEGRPSCSVAIVREIDPREFRVDGGPAGPPAGGGPSDEERDEPIR